MLVFVVNTQWSISPVANSTDSDWRYRAAYLLSLSIDVTSVVSPHLCWLFTGIVGMTI